MLVVLFAAVALGSSLGPLEWQAASTSTFRVVATQHSPGSRELVAGAVSGDAVFTFGGLDEKGFHDSLYAWGTNASGAQEWRFLNGNKTVNSVGRFGTPKVMSLSNFPSARAGSCMAFLTSSHAVLFGGRGIDAAGRTGFLQDLWVSEDMVQWGHFAGKSEANALGVLEGAQATPASRWKHTCGGHPETKAFVVFGGIGPNPDPSKHEEVVYDDLFLYNESGWTFLSGGSHSQPPDYDNPNTLFRNPGSRGEHGSVLVENLLYTFGGQTVSSHAADKGEVMMADLWYYSLLTNHWTFAAGSKVANTHGSYPGAYGQGGPHFGPGARVAPAVAYNMLTNEIYIFGGFGYGYVPGQLGYLNDLWSYNTVDNNFYWLSGSSGLNSHGSFTALPLAPPARASALLFSGNDGYETELIMLGGVALEAPTRPEGLADAWMVNVKVPQGFTVVAPLTTLPPASTHASTSASTHAAASSTSHSTTESEEETTTRKRPPTVTATLHPPVTATSSHVVATGKPIVSSHKEPLPYLTRKSKTTGGTPDPRQNLFDSGSPQKVAALVLGSFIAILLLIGGIVFLGFAFVSSPATPGSRSVLEPYQSV